MLSDLIANTKKRDRKLRAEVRAELEKKHEAEIKKLQDKIKELEKKN